MKWLTLLMLLPLAGAAIISALPKASEKAAKQAALGTTLVVMAATIAMAVGFERDNVDLQFVEKYSWIPSFGINYALGVDAIALVLILMSTILAPVVVLAGWNEAHGGRWSVKTFYILILVLETMMIGVFAATDVFLFYVIFEAMLIPVYFLIGGYGSGERSAAAVKFLIYSLVGGLLMLASIIALYVMCVPSDEALAVRDDIAFFDAVRAQIGKAEGVDREGVDKGAALDTAIRQIVSEAMSGSGVIDIYDEAGISKPDISLIDDNFVSKFQKSSTPNLQIEMLKRILSAEIGRIGKRNVVTGRAFSELLQQSLLRYQNRTLDAAQVVAELVELAKSLQQEADRGTQLGLNDDELAFYDAIRTNDSAVLELGDDTLKKIAHELVGIVRRDAKTDWSVKEQVRAALRAAIKRLLLRYGYPPDQEEAATALVLDQAEVIAGGETE